MIKQRKQDEETSLMGEELWDLEKESYEQVTVKLVADTPSYKNQY